MQKRGCLKPKEYFEQGPTAVEQGAHTPPYNKEAVSMR